MRFRRKHCAQSRKSALVRAAAGIWLSRRHPRVVSAAADDAFIRGWIRAMGYLVEFPCASGRRLFGFLRGSAACHPCIGTRVRQSGSRLLPVPCLGRDLPCETPDRDQRRSSGCLPALPRSTPLLGRGCVLSRLGPGASCLCSSRCRRGEGVTHGCGGRPRAHARRRRGVHGVVLYAMKCAQPLAAVSCLFASPSSCSYVCTRTRNRIRCQESA